VSIGKYNYGNQQYQQHDFQIVAVCVHLKYQTRVTCPPDSDDIMGLRKGIDNENTKMTAAWAFLNKMLRSRGLRGFTVGADGLPPPLQLISTVSLLLREADSSRSDLQPPGNCAAGNLHGDVPVSIMTNKNESQDRASTTQSIEIQTGSGNEELLLRQIDLLKQQNTELEQKIMAMETNKGSVTQQLTPALEGAANETTPSQRFSEDDASCPTVSPLSHVPVKAQWVQSPSMGSADAYVAELDCLLQQLQTERRVLQQQEVMGDRSEDGTAAAVSSLGRSEHLPAEEEDIDVERGGMGDIITLQRCLQRCCTVVFRNGCGFLPEAQLSAGLNDLPAVLEHWVSELKRLASLEDTISDVSNLLYHQVPDDGPRGPVILGSSEILSRLRRLLNLAEEAKAANGVVATAQMAERAGGPSALPMELIKHFQLIFDCPDIGGVLSCMNKVYIDLQAARNFKKTIASIMGVHEDERPWSEATMAAIITDLIRRYWESEL